MAHRFSSRIAVVAGRINSKSTVLANALLGHREFPIFNLMEHGHRRHGSSDMTGVSFSPLPDAELKIQLYYKKQEIKHRKEKLKEIAQSIWNKKSNVNYTRITLDQCKTMYEEHTGHTASPWEAKEIYGVHGARVMNNWFHFYEMPVHWKEIQKIGYFLVIQDTDSNATLQQYAPWRHFQEETERQRNVAAMIEEIYNDLQKEMKQGKDLALSKSDMTILLEKKLGELPFSKDVEDMWMDRFRLPLVKWLE